MPHEIVWLTPLELAVRDAQRPAVDLGDRVLAGHVLRRREQSPAGHVGEVAIGHVGDGPAVPQVSEPNRVETASVTVIGTSTASSSS